MSETFVWTDERSRWLSEEVAELFSEGESGLPAIDVGDTQGVLDPVEQMAGLDAGRLGAGEKIYIGVRGSYGGVLMVGLATGLIGMTLINPLSLLAGVLVGRRAYREDMSARLTRRQHEAKTLVRRYIDEVMFQVGKQLKDRLRLVQRSARDHFGSMAEELHRSLSEALSAAKQAAGTYTSKRDERVTQLQASSSGSRRCARRSPALPPDCGSGGRAAVNGPTKDDAEALLRDRAREVYDDDPEAQAVIAELERRLREPLRLAIAGMVKAGKSTLLNAMLGEQIAPTDAGECTRVVTWYRYSDDADHHDAPARR